MLTQQKTNHNNNTSPTTRRAKKRFTKRIAMLFALSFVFLLSSETTAQTYIGANLGLWSNNANWNTGTAPVSGDPNLTITYSGFGFFTTTNDIAGPFSLQSFVLSSGAGNFTIDASSSPLIFDNLGAGPTIENQSSSRNLTIFAPVELAETLTINGTGNGRQIFDGVVSGTGGLTLNGSGITELQGSSSNTFSGLTTVNEGTSIVLEKTNATALAGDLHVIGGTATISGTGGNQINDSSAITIEATAASNGRLSVNEDETVGNLSLKSDASRSARVIIGSGKTLTLSDNLTAQANATGTAGSSISGGTLDLGNAVRTFDIADGMATDDIAISSAITNGGLNKTGDGTLNLTGANTYSGGTTVSGGVLQGTTTSIQGDIVNDATVRLTGSGSGIYSGNMSGSGGLEIQSGNLTLSGTNSFTGGIQFNSSGTLTGDTDSLSTDISTITSSNTVLFAQATNGTFANSISGSGRLTKTMPGELTLGDVNTYTGMTTIDEGTLRLGAANALPSGSFVTISSGANLDLNNFDASIGRLSGDGDIDLGTGNLEVAPTSTSLFGGTISGTGSLTKLGTRELRLSGEQTYTGGTNVFGGELRLDADERLADTGDITIDNSARLELNSAMETVGAVNLANGTILGSATLIGSAYDLENGFVQVALGGSSGLNKNGSGFVTLSGINSYTGDTVVNDGTLSLSGSERIADTGKVIVNGGIFDQDGETISELELNSGQVNGLALTASAFNLRSGTVGAGLAGSGALTKTTADTVELTSNNSYSGGTTVSAGTLIGSGSNSLQGDIINDGILQFDGAHSYSGNISGSGSVEITSNNVSFSGNNTYTGSTTIQNGGKLRAAPSNLAGDVSLAGSSSTLEFFHSADETYADVISGSGRVTKRGGGELTLTNANIFSGGLILEQGSLAIGNDAAIGTGDLTLGIGSTIRATGAARVINNNTTVNRNVTFSGTEDLTFNDVDGITLGNGESLTSSNTGTTTLVGEFLGEAGSTLESNGGGNFVVGDASSFTGFRTSGNLSVASGSTLTLQSAGFIDMSASTILAGGTLAASNGVAFASSENLTGSGTINAKIAAQHGSIIAATTGNMTVGRASSVGGFFSDGELHTNQFNVTINDANDAVLGSITRMGNGTTGGSLIAGTASNGDTHTHFLLEEGKNLIGRGTVEGNFKNQGHVIGDGTAMDERIVFGSDWTVKGIGEFTNTLVLGTFAPGESPGITTGTNQAFAGILEFELGGLTPGFGSGNHDQIIDLATVSLFDDPTISILDYEGFLPSLGDEFEVMTWETGLVGNFGTLQIDPFFTSNGISFDMVIDGINGTGGLTLVASSAVPEPSTGFALGLLAVGLLSRRRHGCRRS